MTIKAYDGTTWQTQKSLKIYNGLSWSTAKQAWIFNGTSWLINYPESPQNVSGASISTLSGTAGRIGCVYIASVGSWNSNDAYIPTSYSYQWTRDGSDVAGQTNNTYTTGAADADKVIGCRVTATNFRGSTPSSATTGLQMLTHVSSLTGSNTTLTVGSPTVSFNPNGLSYSGSWNLVPNATTYETTSGGTAGSPSVDLGNRIFSGTGTAGNASFSVRAVNTNRRISLSWTAATGATSYDLYVNGGFFGNVGNTTTYPYTPPDDNARNFTIYPRSSGNVQGYGASVTSTIAAPATRSDYGTGSGNLVQPNATSPTSANASVSSTNLSVSWSGATNATKYRVYWAQGSSISLDPAVSYDAPEWTGTSASYNGSYGEGNTYYFYISASGDNNVWTPYGGYKASGTVPVTAPGTPSVSISSITASSFLISWGATAGADSYAVSVGTSPGGSNILNTSGITDTSRGVTGLSASTTYYATVTAYKNIYGFGSPGSTSATTTQSPTINFGTPTRPTFYRSGTTVKWGMDNPSFSGPFDPYGIEWEVGNNASTGNISSGNTKSYNTSYISTSGLGSVWNYIVGTHAGDIPATSSPRYLRFRIYGYNTVTNAFVDGPWSPWSL
jgi:hypothetical protein